MKHIHRQLRDSILSSLKNYPIVFVNGPRQAGKSTLAQKLSQDKFPAHYISLDNAMQAASAVHAPYEFLSAYRPLIIDEIQMAPQLFLPMKELVDQSRMKSKKKSNGIFLLTGSTSLMALPRLSDALVGRMSVKTLYPFSAVEVFGGQADFLTRLFNKNFKNLKVSQRSLNQAIHRATFPDISGKSIKYYSEWFDSYLTTLFQRDVKMLSQISKINVLPKLLKIFSSRAGNIINDAILAQEAGLNAVTGKEYRSILQALFLTFTIPPWHKNVRKRLIKSHKGYVIDSLLLCHLQGWSLSELSKKKLDVYGHIVENFVAVELLKLLSFSSFSAQLLHFRTSDNKEVDFILEKPNGQLAAIEVKAGKQVSLSDFKHIQIFQQLCPDQFICGIVLYQGQKVVAFGKNLFAVPLMALWQ